MSRVYYLRDANGDRQVAESALPLQFGGEGQCDLVVPGLKAGTVEIKSRADGERREMSLDAARAWIADYPAES